MYQKKFKLWRPRSLLVIVVIVLIFTLYTLDFSTIIMLRGSFKVKPNVTFDVSTSACKIPHMDPFDKSIMKFIKNETQYCDSKPKLVEANDTHLIVQEKAFSAYGIQNTECYYQNFWRVPPKINHVDRYYKYNQTKNYFNRSIEVNEEFVYVYCETKEKEGYADYFAFVHVKEIPNRKTNSTENKLNVLVIGMDSVSRLNFYRQMPRTRQFIVNELDGIEFFGYNKVADNTFPNIMPVLAGLSKNEVYNSCNKLGHYDRFDNCSFIWKEFHKAGYATAFAEEMTFWGLFTNGMGGFNNVPVMHYWETFGMQIETYIKILYQKKCKGFIPTIQYLLDYTLRFIKTYRKAQTKYFGFFWESIVTHETLNYDPKLDEYYVKHLQDIKEGNYLNDTILFLMSDHGRRVGEILETFQGRMEDRLPYFYVVVPDWFKRKYPEVVKNIKRNSKLLTSHFDLHATFKSVMNEDYSTGESYERGISLFKLIPENRTCESAGIPAQWCTCQPMVQIDVTNKTVITVTDFVIRHMMAVLQNKDKCAKLKVDKIIDARIFDEDFSDKKIRQVIYKVNFRTNPGGGLFEATVNCETCDSDFAMAGSVARHNIYGNQSHCVQNPVQKLYCFCE